jgi:vancomycin resistance protein YoaR
MQATDTNPRSESVFTGRNLSWFMVAPVTVIVIFSILLALVVTSYQKNHADRVFTGVSVWDIDLSGMTQQEAQRTLSAAFPYPREESIVLIDPKTEEQWVRAPAQLGISFDVDATVDAAFDVGRDGNPFARLGEQFTSWYYGAQIAPIVVFDESQLDRAVAQIATEINQPATDASLAFDGSSVGFASAQVGRSLDVSDVRNRLITPISNLREAQIQLLVHETQPRIHDTSLAAEEIQNVMSGPMTLYLQEPLSGVDLDRVTIPSEELIKWMRVQTIEDELGQATTQVYVDENAVRAWLEPYAAQLQRDPVNARFYFDDNTQDLVLVEPHVNGRILDVDATVEQFVQQVMTPNRSMPFVMKDVVPAAHSKATAADLGITELVSESTTWFFDSSTERRHNIARSATNFYGIIIAPGEEFSFNQFLGEVTEDQGYETGLIIFGGRTIEGVGGGVCQVSTTAFQAAFWAGFPIVERWEHGYRVGYYDDGEGPGVDATVYSPLVDFRFINDTPYHLLIENYYSAENSSLTFKFYSTSLGRTVVKDGPIIENVTAPNPDIWELNEDLETGEIEQVDWAVEGADVTVGRSVYNANGELIRQENFVSHYIPWQNIFQYGPGTVIPEPEPDETPTPGPTVEPTPEPTQAP